MPSSNIQFCYLNGIVKAYVPFCVYECHHCRYAGAAAAPEVKLAPASASAAGPSASGAPPLSTSVAVKPTANGGGQLWVERYKPASSRELVGNIGCIEWLRAFLDNWCAKVAKLIVFSMLTQTSNSYSF